MWRKCENGYALPASASIHEEYCINLEKAKERAAQWKRNIADDFEGFVTFHQVENQKAVMNEGVLRAQYLLPPG